MFTSIIMAGLVALNSQVYVAKFTNTDIKNKAKISLHHALLKESTDGVYFDLNKFEANILRNHDVLLIPANSQWQTEYSTLKNISLHANNMSGIPGYDCYDTVEETLAEINILSENHPNVTQLIDIGDSWQKASLGSNGYDLMVLKIGNKELIDPPILFIQSGLHAREYATVGLTMAFAKYLLENRDEDPDVAWILDRHQIHILFQANPDGRKIAENGIYQRKNHNENHCPYEAVGIDLNRNYTSTWNTVPQGSSGNSCSEVFRGESAGSEPEVQAIEAYARSIYPDNRAENKEASAPSNTKGLFLDIHSYSELILWPWGDVDSPAPNHKGLEALGRKLAFFNNYFPMQSVGLYPTDGTSDALAYDELGIAHITFELGTQFFQSCSVFENKIKPDNLKALLYAAKVVEKPYELTQGPDITDFLLESNTTNELIFSATATELNFNNYQGSIPTENIASVRYSINEYLSETNSVLANFKDGSNDSNKEDINITLDKSLFYEADVTLYIQGKDAAGYVGPVSAFQINNTLPQLSADIVCHGAKCDFTGLNDEQGITTHWYISEDKISNELNAQFIMPSVGDYTAQYKITNLFNNTATKDISFKVSELLQPIANFSYACNKLICSFNAEASSDSDSINLTYEWVLSNNESKNGIKIDHTYASEGKVSVTLHVTDEHNQTGTMIQKLTISDGVETEIVPQITKKEPSKSGGSFGFIYLNFLILSGFIRLKRRLI